MPFSTTAKHALRWLTGGSNISDIDAGFQALAEDLDAIIATADKGLLANRPASTPGSPGRAGRIYTPTDAKRLSTAHGTGGDEIPAAPAGDLAAGEGLWWNGTEWVSEKVTRARLAPDVLDGFLKLLVQADRNANF